MKIIENCLEKRNMGNREKLCTIRVPSRNIYIKQLSKII